MELRVWIADTRVGNESCKKGYTDSLTARYNGDCTCLFGKQRKTVDSEDRLVYVGCLTLQ